MLPKYDDDATDLLASRLDEPLRCSGLLYETMAVVTLFAAIH